MKCSVVLSDGVKRVMLTPESENEKMALSMIGVDDDITVERKEGNFFDSNRPQGYSVSMCQGGYLRAFESTESLMLVLRDKKPEQEPEQ